MAVLPEPHENAGLTDAEVQAPWPTTPTSMGRMVARSHSPGPWAASIGTRGATIYVHNYAAHPLTIHFNWNEFDAELTEEAQANARLIAAAPELLAACQAATEALTPHGDEAWGKRGVIRKQLEAAIAKATGGGRV